MVSRPGSQVVPEERGGSEFWASVAKEMSEVQGLIPQLWFSGRLLAGACCALAPLPAFQGAPTSPFYRRGNRGPGRWSILPSLVVGLGPDPRGASSRASALPGCHAQAHALSFYLWVPQPQVVTEQTVVAGWLSLRDCRIWERREHVDTPALRRTLERTRASPACTYTLTRTHLPAGPLTRIHVMTCPCLCHVYQCARANTCVLVPHAQLFGDCNLTGAPGCPWNQSAVARKYGAGKKSGPFPFPLGYKSPQGPPLCLSCLSPFMVLFLLVTTGLSCLLCWEAGGGGRWH